MNPKTLKPLNNSNRIVPQALFLILVAGAPVAHLSSLLAVWTVPMSWRWQRRMLVAAEVFNASACLEVLATSIITAVAEISRFAQFIIGG
eukprot:3098622-Pyramimonas_sp.AAC.1